MRGACRTFYRDTMDTHFFFRTLGVHISDLDMINLYIYMIISTESRAKLEGVVGWRLSTTDKLRRTLGSDFPFCQYR